jgi:predicted HTH transcriptional regulator
MSIRRNPLISRILYSSNEIESFGTGIKKIYDSCQEANVKVDFRISKFGFTVIFYRKEDDLIKNADVSKPQNQNDYNMILSSITESSELTKSEIDFIKAIIPLIIKDSSINNEEARTITKISATSVKRKFKRFRDLGIFESYGTTRDRRYKFTESIKTSFITNNENSK